MPAQQGRPVFRQAGLEDFLVAVINLARDHVAMGCDMHRIQQGHSRRVMDVMLFAVAQPGRRGQYDRRIGQTSIFHRQGTQSVLKAFA